MASIDDFLASLPIDQLAAQLGVAPAEVEAASRNAVPALVQGMQANAMDEDRAKSLATAIAAHARQAAVEAQTAPDEADGEKIVRNVFGDNTEAVVNQLGRVSPGGSGLMSKLLPLLAPLVMGSLGGLFGGGNKQNATADDNGGGLGDLLGGLLGGGSGDGGGLSDMLGGLLGGGSSGGGGGLGDLLGGLLGGGRK